jgi:predicted RNA-binding protein with PUA domain
MKKMHELLQDDLAGIARYEVSEDGIAWRPYNPKEDGAKTLHKRIEFADADDGAPLSAQPA